MVCSGLGLSDAASGLLIGRQGLLAHQSPQFLAAGQPRQAIGLAGTTGLLWSSMALAAPCGSIDAFTGRT